MLDFNYYNPTRIVFGKDKIKELESLVSKDKKVLVVYGGGSIKKNGVYDQVMTSLKDHTIFEFSGIEPNPEYETCLKVISYIKEKDIDFILAVGGGSVIDAVKFISAGVYFDGDPWDIIEKQAQIKKAMDFGTVLTLPATGSEMNRNSVISRKEIGDKKSFTDEKVFPQFSILDPKTTFSLPEKQTINGIVDAFVHVMEQYMTYDVNTPLQDRQAEAVLMTLIEQGPKVLKNPTDYDARANVMWCATHALNFNLMSGVVNDWSTHRIGHELTAKFGIDHAQSLAVVMPYLWKNQFKYKKGKLAQYGKRIFGLSGSQDDVAKKAIEKTVEFFNDIGMKTKLSDYGISYEDTKPIAQKLSSLQLGENQAIGKQEILEIFKMGE